MRENPVGRDVGGDGERGHVDPAETRAPRVESQRGVLEGVFAAEFDGAAEIEKTGEVDHSGLFRQILRERRIFPEFAQSRVRRQRRGDLAGAGVQRSLGDEVLEVPERVGLDRQTGIRGPVAAQVEPVQRISVRHEVVGGHPGVRRSLPVAAEIRAQRDAPGSRRNRRIRSGGRTVHPQPADRERGAAFRMRPGIGPRAPQCSRTALISTP